MRLALAITLSVPTTLYAQPVPTESATPTPQPTPAGTPAKTIGIDGAVILPLSDYADDAKLGFGLLLRYEIPRSGVFSITLRTGGLGHLAAERRDTLLLFPGFVGIQVRFADRWFFTADAGIMFRYQGDSAAAIGVAFGVGYRKGKGSVRGEILVPDLGTADSTAGLMIAVGFSP